MAAEVTLTQLFEKAEENQEVQEERHRVTIETIKDSERSLRETMVQLLEADVSCYVIRSFVDALVSVECARTHAEEYHKELRYRKMYEEGKMQERIETEYAFQSQFAEVLSVLRQLNTTVTYLEGAVDELIDGKDEGFANEQDL